MTALHAVANKNIQDKIERFVGNSNIEKSVAALNQRLIGLSGTTTDEKDDKSFHKFLEPFLNIDNKELKTLLTNSEILKILEKIDVQPKIFIELIKEEKKKINEKSGFTNKNYIILANSLKIKPETAEKFKTLGTSSLMVDFSKSDETADLINGIVKGDTNGKIPELFSKDSFSSDDVFILLHTLYVKDKWDMYDVKDCYLDFKDQKDFSKTVKGFKVESKCFQYQQKDNTTYLALPTREGYYVIIRHDEKGVRPISASEINDLLKSKAVYTRSIKVPFVSMEAEHDLKNLLVSDLPEILTKSFPTELCDQSILISQYIQKLIFDMDDKGIKASAATALRSYRESGCWHENGPEVIINSPFSFALVKMFKDQILLLFSGQVVNDSVLKPLK
ncbi:MAG: serpin family protein [Janthinobacterium lividum]